MKANYHTHLVYCNHAVGHTEDYVKKALELGFDELGISDHGPVLECFMPKDVYLKNWCHRNVKLDTVYSKLLPEVYKAKEDYKGKIKILVGFETEYIDGNAFFIKILRSKVDYLNLGVHYFDYNSDILNSYSEVNFKSIYGYADTCVKGMESGLFNTLVHPDLFMFRYRSEANKREFDKHCELATRKIIESAIKNNVYLELNANGIKNSGPDAKYGEWLYPCKEFWQIVKEYNDVKIIIGADAHSPSDLESPNIKLASEFASELGLKIDEHMEINH